MGSIAAVMNSVLIILAKGDRPPNMLKESGSYCFAHTRSQKGDNLFQALKVTAKNYPLQVIKGSS